MIMGKAHYQVGEWYQPLKTLWKCEIISTGYTSIFQNQVSQREMDGKDSRYKNEMYSLLLPFHKLHLLTRGLNF